MPSSIKIIGEIPQADLNLIESAAKEFDIAVGKIDSVKSPGSAVSDISQGFISYLPCTSDEILEIFSNLPIGSNEQFPFFQIVDTLDYPEFLNDYPVSGVFQTPISTITVRNIMNTIMLHEKISLRNKSVLDEFNKYRKQRQQFLKIATALSSQNNLDTLLELILSESRDIVNADAGSIYIRERKGSGKTFSDKLRFKISQNDSVKLASNTNEFVIDIDKNRIASYVAFTGETLNIRDVYQLDDSVPYNFGKDFDKRFGYRMKSMLTIALKNIEGDVVGVLQLMNKKRSPDVKLTSAEITLKEVVPFSYSDEELVNSIAPLVAVSIERAELYESIERIFEGFLSSSIAAIDERDRITSGHSRRVMDYAMAFVDAINKAHEGAFADIHFSDDEKRQFKFAALLHDIGKIGVPEKLLTKESRLSKGDFNTVLARLDNVRFMLISGVDVSDLSWKSIEEVDNALSLLKRINGSAFIGDSDYEHLQSLKNKWFKDSYGEKKPVLTEKELEALSVRKGNLTISEKETVNSHAMASCRILSKIPWTQELEKIPQIAAHHHEKIDGTGYPDGLHKEEIYLESKILAVVDIYDALVAWDRPYKPAIKPAKALEILKAEVKAGHLDSEIVDFFIKNSIYKIYSG